jgi:hypothetical protein
VVVVLSGCGVSMGRGLLLDCPNRSASDDY